MPSYRSTLALTLCLALAQICAGATLTHGLVKILVGASGLVTGVDFSGTAFNQHPNASTSESGWLASWMVFKEPDLLYVVDENSNATRLLHYTPETGEISEQVAVWNGSSGVVHLAFTQDKTRLIGSSYGQGQIDVWNSSAPDGSLTLFKQVSLVGDHGPDPRQTQLRAHQSVLDPTGNFFIVNDLGGDMLHVLDTRADNFTISNIVQTKTGCGPRHGAFVQLDGGQRASHYVVVCELSNLVLLFKVSYEDDVKGLLLVEIDTRSTFGPAFPPYNATSAAAGALVVAQSGAVYVSNRLTGNETDSISHFTLEKKAADDNTPVLAFKGQVSSGGIGSRAMSLSKDENFMFIANVNGVSGLVALPRDELNGSLGNLPVGNMTNTVFRPGQPENQGYGPMFVLEV